MVEEKFILISMEDDRAKKLADVLGNKTCKKVIDYLADHEEASVKDISDALGIPINTSEYNVKKLLAAELLQKRKNFFWSKKGKKIVMYELSNKSIIIAPKGSKIGPKLKAILPAFIVVGVGAFVSYVFGAVKKTGTSVIAPTKDLIYDSAPVMMEAAGKGIDYTQEIIITPNPAWLWFLAGGLITLFIVSLVNWRKL